MKVLFLCTHNSARSQMAEGLLRSMYPDNFYIESAGLEETQVRPLAIKAMEEIGIDITSHYSKKLDRFLEDDWDYVITVCDSANEVCPFFPGGKERIHRSFKDPSQATGTEYEQLAVWRSVRDEIRAWIEEFFGPMVS